MAQKLGRVLSYIFLILLNASMLLSHPLMTNTTRNSLPLSYLKNLIGAQKGNQTKGIFELKRYLSSIGYMKIIDENFETSQKQVTNQNLFDDNLEYALKKYQRFFKLNLSGILDSQIVSHLSLPRCGVPDFFSYEIHKTNLTHFKVGSLFNFFPGEPKWWKRDLTYSFAPGTRTDVVRPIANAMVQWSWATLNSFTFTYIPDYDQANIKISFQVWNHGDGSNFDGPGGILAHAFAPSDGRLHYDGSEDWVDGAIPHKFDLQTVGLHEMGHILGLEHSGEPSAIMYPRINSGTRKDLSQDDWVEIDVFYNIRKNLSFSSMYRW